MKPHMRRELVIDALHMAWFRRKPDPGVIFPTDRPRQPTLPRRVPERACRVRHAQLDERQGQQ
jgi:transposase InsO family protein